MNGFRIGLVGLALFLCACSKSSDLTPTEITENTAGSLVSTSVATRVSDSSEERSPETSIKAIDDPIKTFEVTIFAPETAHGYSEIDITVVSDAAIAKVEIISDRLDVVSSGSDYVTVRTPIIQQDEVIKYEVRVSAVDGAVKTSARRIKVVLYDHDVDHARHLSPADLSGTVTDDYAVFNFGFETVFINERYTETYCYPTIDDCSTLDGSFTADAHNSMVGDFNGDGHQDLVVAWVIFPHTLTHEAQSTVRVYINNGSGRLIADPTIYSLEKPPERQMAYRLIVDDFNLDGVDDVFAGSMGLLKLLPTGERELILDSHVLLLSDNGNLVDASDTIDYGDTHFFAHDASSGDINGDGFPDILAGRTLFLNKGGEGFVSAINDLPEIWSSDWSGYVMSSLLDDFNGDGLADPVFLWGDAPDRNLKPRPPQIAISDRQTPSAEWQVHNLPTGPFGAGTTKFNHAASADIDNDGDMDIVIGTTRSAPYYVGRFLQVLVNDGSGHFDDISEEALGEQPRALNHQDPNLEVECTVQGEGQVILLDIDNDGDIDITDRTNGGKDGASDACPGISIHLNDGNGIFVTDEKTQLASVRQNQIPGFAALPNNHEIGNAIPIDLDGRLGIDYVTQIRSPWGGTFSFLYQLMSLR